MFNESDIVVYNGIIAEWGIVKLFFKTDGVVPNLVRYGTQEEISRHVNRVK